MDRKSITVLIVLMLALLAANQVINRIYPPIRVPASTNGVTQLTNAAGGTNAIADGTATTPTPAPAALTSIPGTTFAVNAQVPEEVLVFSNDLARYTFTTRGGGLKTVELLNNRKR